MSDKSPYLYQPVIIFQEEAVQDLKHMSVSNPVSVRFFLLLVQGGSYTPKRKTLALIHATPVPQTKLKILLSNGQNMSKDIKSYST